MNEERLLRLVRAAEELEQFESHVSGRTDTNQDVVASIDHVRRFRRAQHRRRVGVTVGLAASVFVGAFFLWPEKLDIESIVLIDHSTRGVDDSREVQIRLSQPAHVRIILIDERNERWLMPLSPDRAYQRCFDRMATFPLPVAPNRADPRGPAQTTHVMVIASHGDHPTTEELLAAIPDPIVAVNGEDLDRKLKSISADLERRFDCVVKFQSVRGDRL